MFFSAGSFTVISAKAVSSMISITFQGSMQLTHPIFYVMIIVMVITAVGQVRCVALTSSLVSYTHMYNLLFAYNFDFSPCPPHYFEHQFLLTGCQVMLATKSVVRAFIELCQP